MKTRDELLAMANELVKLAVNHAHNANNGDFEGDAIIATGIASAAQACVMLAKEMREGEDVVPIVISVESEKPIDDMKWVVERLNKMRREAK